MNKLILVLFWFMLLTGCGSGHEDGSKNRMERMSREKADESRPKNVFKNVGYLHGHDYGKSSGMIFKRVGDVEVVKDEMRMELFYLNFNNRELIGFWGIEAGSLFYAPYDNPCGIHYLIAHLGKNGYFTLNETEDCFDFNLNYIGDGYSFKSFNLGERRTAIFQFVNPKFMVNISEEEYLREVSILSMVVDIDDGVLFFDYEIDLNKAPVIPWLSSTLSESDL
jgi:hypothetical protein